MLRFFFCERRREGRGDEWKGVIFCSVMTLRVKGGEREEGE